MYEVDFSKPIHIHFIGIGGISMSGLAEILLKENFTISGSDAKESDLTRHLTSLGAQVFYGQKAENIIPGIDLVVYTAAIHPDNPEFAAAKAAGIPMLTRAELLGQIMRNYNTPIAVSGTHGKTTTTSMLSHILMAADCDPTISVGGILPSIGGNIRVGHSETFLTEACEYTNSFLSFFPKIGIILNMDADHLDFFKDIDDIRHSFREFARLLPADGMLIINADTPKYDYVTEGLGCKIVTYALENQAVADYTAANITYDELVDLVYSLKRPYRKSAAFLTNDQTIGYLRKLKDQNGHPLWHDSVEDGEPGRILGYKVYTSPYFPVMTAGMPAIAFGDYSYYNIGDRGSRSFKQLNELFAGNGMIGFVAKERVDGKLILPEAVQILKLKSE